MKIRNSIYNILCSLIGQIITIAIGIIIPRLFIVNYGSEVNGLMSSVNQLFVYLGLLEAGIGAATVQSLYSPISVGDNKKISGILSATSVSYRKISIVYCLLLALVAFIYPLVIDSEIGFWTIFGIIICSGLGTAVNFAFQGKYKLYLEAVGKGYFLTNMTTILHLITSISKIVCIYMGFDILIIQAVFFAINCIQVPVIYTYMRKKYPDVNCQEPPDFEAISKKNSVFLHQISGLIFQNTDVLILTVFCGLKVVSVYSMYKLIVNMILVAITSVSNGVTFLLGNAYTKGVEFYKKVIDIYNCCYTMLACILYSLLYIYILPFMKLYTAGVDDIPYIDEKLAILFVVIELLGVGRNAMLQTINVAGHFEETRGQSIIESILNLVTSLIGVQIMGIYGVLLGTIVALLYRTTLINLYANHKILRRKSNKTFGVWFFNILLMLLIVNVFQIGEVNNYFQFVLNGLKSALIIAPIFLVSNMLLFYKDYILLCSKLRNTIIKNK